MLRISEQEGSAEVRLRLEGRLVGTWADELRRTCASFQARGRRLSPDLSGVTFADTAGVALLRELARGEATIADCTPFLALQMEE